MSEIQNMLNKLEGTGEAEILKAMEEAFSRVTSEQTEWYQKSQFFCPEGCGECCRNFEPDLLECEALYMAAWLLENQPEVAQKVAQDEFPYPQNNGCLFWDEHNPYHCTIYGGRAFICRLFGACGSHSKTGETVFKPCRFYSTEKLAAFKTPLEHRQYSQSETKNIFGTLPPVMSDLMEKAISINPDNHQTKLIRDILPDTVKKLLWICQMNEAEN